MLFLMKILALIPARGGSKGVTKKNIRTFNGKPLIASSIGCAKLSKNVDRVMVSTEDEEIASISKEYGAEVPFLRPTELSGDTSQVMDAILYHLDMLKTTENYVPTHLLLLQTTSPLRRPEDIDRAVELLESHNADSLVSVCRTENILFVKDADDRLSILNEDLLKNSNRQELPKYYKLDGCMIYLIKTDVLKKEKSFFAGKLIGYEIERWRAVDLDEPQDFVIGEILHEKRDEIVRKINNFS